MKTEYLKIFENEELKAKEGEMDPSKIVKVYGDVDLRSSGGSEGGEDKIHLEVHGKRATNINVFNRMIFIKGKMSLEELQSIINPDIETYKPFRIDVYADNDNDNTSTYCFSIDSDIYFPSTPLGFFPNFDTFDGTDFDVYFWRMDNFIMSSYINYSGEDEDDEFETKGILVSKADLHVLSLFSTHAEYIIRYLDCIIFYVDYIDDKLALDDVIDVQHTPIYNYDTNKFVRIKLKVNSLDDISYE